MMQIWPAIDLRAGRCVRLRQGDYNQETIFGEDPAAMARHFVAEGATCLHLVDLDGAKDATVDNSHKPISERVANWKSISAIVRAVDIPCELGGGIRDEATIAGLLELGLAQLVVGTLALKQPEWFRSMCRKFPGKLVLGIDARDGRVATHGWLETSDTEAIPLAQDFAREPLAAIVYTDIAQDGMLQGPNVAAMQAMQAAVSVPVIASGGVSSAGDVALLARAGMAGCIVGRALYENRLTIAQAHAAALIHD